jgi:uncharacterized Ntn-hydrolase superfamily protein
VTDLSLGPKGLDLLSKGKAAKEVIDGLVTNTPTIG